MSYEVLTPNEVEQFMELGWVKLEEAFLRKHALAAQQIVWDNVEKRDVLRHDKSTWTEPLLRLNENYDTAEFQACNTERIADAVEDLVGKGRWQHRGKSAAWGWWPVNFSLGANKPWDVPTAGWHYDGQHFRHFVDSWEQGLLLLCLFSDIGPRGGGTVIAEGSHKIVAKVLEGHPDGLELGESIQLAKQHPWLAELTGATSESEGSEEIYAAERELAATSDSSSNRIERFMNKYTESDGIQLKVVETTGSPGDVLLCHPFLFHSTSQNHSGTPRFMCNRTTPLKERLNIHGNELSPYSPLELSIRRSLRKD